jgi:hypothetical protein
MWYNIGMGINTKTEVKTSREKNKLSKLAANLGNKLKTQAKTPAEKKAVKQFIDKLKVKKQLKIKDLVKIIAETLPKSVIKNLKKNLSAYPSAFVEKLLEKIKMEKFIDKFNTFLSNIDVDLRTKYMAPGNKQHLLQKYSKYFKEGEKGYPLQTTIAGKKWHVTDTSIDDSANIRRMIKRFEDDEQFVKQLKEGLKEKKTKENLKNMYLIDPENPLIQVSFSYKDFKKNPEKILREKAKLAKQEWKEQKENEEKLRKFDLPKGPRIAYLSLYPGYMSIKHPHHSPDPMMKKNQHVNEMQPAILRQNGYNIEKSKITYTDSPEEVIKKKLKELRRAKPPIKHIVINISTHGLSKEHGGGSTFVDKAPDPPKELPVDVIHIIRMKKISNPKLSIPDLLKKYYFKTQNLSGKQSKEFKKYLSLWNRYKRALHRHAMDPDKKNRLHGDELVKICRAHKDIKFFIKSSSCFGGDFERYFKKANLPNVVLSLASQEYHVATGAAAREKEAGETKGSAEYNSIFYTKALIHMGKTLKVPLIVNGKMQFDASGKPKMKSMKIKTIGDAIYYADIMSAYMGSLDDPETVIPK